MTTMAPAASTVTFACRDISKGFGGIPVLTGLNLELAAGEVVALAGENGAGKSTLLKIIAGQVRPDAGELTMSGEAIGRYSAAIAHRHGISIVPQELAPVPDMTVAENIFLGRELRTRWGTIDRKGQRARAASLLDGFGLDIEPSTPMRRLTVALQQIVEILKNTFHGSKVLLLDEPTSAISTREVGRLYGIIDRLRSEGVAIVYTTHKMEEIRATADRVVILRDGALIVDRPAAEISDDNIVSAMIGRELEALFPGRLTVPADTAPALQIEGLGISGFSGSLDLTVRPGEIVALAGLVGAGRTELLEGIYGSRQRTGRVSIGGRPLAAHRPHRSIDEGIGFVPEDRKQAGLVLSMSIFENGILPHLRAFSSAGWLAKSRARGAVDEVMSGMQLKRTSLNQGVSTLSGGNQQKVVLGRWLTHPTKVLLLDEPTRGVDIGARSEIYRIIADLAASGVAVLMASSDMAEVIGLAHRVVVIRDAGAVGELDSTALDADAQTTIFRLAAGLTTGATK
ncbi:sugar ABC transporter ATP-binding protein [Microbacterium saperdae]